MYTAAVLTTDGDRRDCGVHMWQLLFILINNTHVVVRISARAARAWRAYLGEEEEEGRSRVVVLEGIIPCSTFTLLI